MQQWRRTDQPEAVAGHAGVPGSRAGLQGDDQDRKVRCRLSWLTNSVLVQYESPNAGVGVAGWVSANEYSCKQNFGDLTPYITYE